MSDNTLTDEALSGKILSLDSRSCEEKEDALAYLKMVIFSSPCKKHQGIFLR